MSQIRLPVAAATSTRERRKRATAWWIDALVVAVVVTLAYGVVAAASRWVAPYTPAVTIDLSPWRLPLYAGLSTFRMALAYLLALAFTLVYARVAAGSRSAERVMIPLLDVLQSIPILSFMPGVVLGLVALFPHSNLGLEIAAVLLIFTSQAWNMTFSFYHSLRVIPKELREAAAVYRLNAWRRFTLLEAPFSMIPLLWNSMMSWAGGWFFLMAAEQFSLGTRSFELPGLGSYLQTAANAGDLRALLLGLGALIVVIILLDQLLWRPLIAWADRFKIEQTSSGVAPASFTLRLLRRSALVAWMSARVWRPLFAALDRGISRLLAPTAPRRMALGATTPEADARDDKAARARQRAVSLALWGAVTALCLWGVLAAVRTLMDVSPGDWGQIGVSALATLARTTLALVIGVAWTVPVGVAIGSHPRLAQRAQPIVQMVASIPATALFPALLLVLLGLPGGLNIAAVALMLLGTQWYVLFNVIAGAMAIPSDLREAGAIYQLRGWRRWRYLILPAIFPYLVTGMITATGGAWNASIVSEYVSFNNHIHSTVGLGALIASA
ncbi:MAG: ABC transporter permease subunit, partial [Chloroflexota bacterium]|nr:ABC transporter permease subunit [Chloroflexota bacterium]